MDKILKKQGHSSKHTLYGMTPLYYLLLSVNGKLLFNEVASKATSPIGFIESTLEVIGIYEDFYINKKHDSLTEEQIKYLEDPEISSLFANLMHNYIGPANGLRDIRKNYYYGKEIYGDSKIGEISFDDLMKVRGGKNTLSHIKAQIDKNNPLTKEEITDLSPSAIAKKAMVVSDLENLLEDILLAVEKIDGQVRVIEGVGISDITTKELQDYFLKVCDEVEGLDNVFMGRRSDGTQNENTYKMSQRLLLTCNEIGFDVSQNISGNLYSDKGLINNDKKIYNQQKINGLEEKKQVFNTAKTIIFNAIQNIKKGEERNLFYF